jgi:hypothetical protein
MTAYREAMGEARRAWEEAVAAARRSAEAALALLSAPERLARQEEALREAAEALGGLRERVEALEEAMREAAGALLAREEGERALRGEVERARGEVSALREGVQALGRLLEGAGARLEELEAAFRGHLEMEREFLRQLAEGGAGLVGVAMAARGQAEAPADAKGEAAVEVAERRYHEGEEEEGPPTVEGEEGLAEGTPAMAPADGAAGSWHASPVAAEGWRDEGEQGDQEEGGGEPEADARELKRRLEERRRALAGERRGLRRFLPLP